MSLLAVAAVLGAIVPARAAPAPTPDRLSGGILVGARTDLRAYSLPGTDPELDSTTGVVVGGILRSTRLSLRAVYSPSFVVQQITAPEHRYYSLQQAGSLGLLYVVPYKRLSISFAVEGALSWSAVPVVPFVANPNPTAPGQTTTTPTVDMNAAGQRQTPNMPPSPTETPTTTVGGKVLPYNVVASIGTLRGTISSSYRFTRRLTLTDAVYVYTAGGIALTQKQNYQSQVLSPLNRGVGGSLGLGYLLGKFDRISTTANVGYTVVLPPEQQDGTRPPDTDAVMVGVAEGYSHIFSKHAAGTISAGYSFADTSAVGQKAVTSGSATGDATFGYSKPLARDSTATFSVGAHYGLALNVYGGGTQPVASGTAGASWNRRRVTATLSGAFSSSIDTTPVTQNVIGSFTVAYLPARFVQLLMGTSLQHSLLPPQVVVAANAAGPAPVVPNEVQWSVFIAASVSAPVLAF